MERSHVRFSGSANRSEAVLKVPKCVVLLGSLPSTCDLANLVRKRWWNGRQVVVSMIFGHFHPEKLGKISNLISIFSDGLKSLTSFSFGGVLEWEHARMVDSTRVAFFLGAEVKVMGEAPILINPRLLRRVSPSATCCLSWILSTEKNETRPVSLTNGLMVPINGLK